MLRPLLAVRWLERYGTPAPIEFQTLLQLLDGEKELLAAIDALLEQKRVSQELGRSPQVPVIHNFIQEELQRVETLVPPRFERKGDVESQLSLLFRQVLAESWG